MQKLQSGLLALLVSCSSPPRDVDAGDEPLDAGTQLTAEIKDAGELPDVADAGVVAAELDAGPPPLPRCVGKLGRAGDFERALDSSGKKRKLLGHAPASYDGKQEVPLLVTLHGVVASASNIRGRTRFDEISENENFIVVYPEGLNQSWNGGICCGLSQVTQVNDVQFIRDVVDLLEEEFCIDPKRIYASGFSNGGFMTHRLGCEMSERFAAIGVGSGQMGGFDCQPKRAVPVVQAHGTMDPVVLLAGNPATGFPSTNDVMRGWATRNGCQPEPEVTELTGLKEKVEFRKWTQCRDQAEVHYYVVEGGTHDWFGNKTWAEPDAFKSSLVFWEFFKQHRLP